jgi:hypothetical protein
MFNTIPVSHQGSFNRIINKHLSKARRSNHESAWTTCERKGMDELTTYCHANNLPMLGDHMIKASNLLQGDML